MSAKFDEARWIEKGGKVSPYEWKTWLRADMLARCTGFVEKVPISVDKVSPHVPKLIKIDEEMLIVKKVKGQSWTVVRGYGETVATAHKSSSEVYIVGDMDEYEL